MPPRHALRYLQPCSLPNHPFSHVYVNFSDELDLKSKLPHVHHGGAGTTATGLRAGCPTTIVPFFGDQYFWGDRIYQRGLGPNPIPISQLTVEALSEAIDFMLQPEVKARAMDLAKLIENEDGVANAVNAFHRHLPADMPLSSIPPSKQEDEDYPNALQWMFTQIGLYCGCGT